MKRNLLYSCLLLLLATACQNSTEKNTASTSLEDVKPAQFKALLESTPDAQLVDVRTPGEYANGTIENAQNIDFNAADFEEKIRALDKDKPVFLFCQAGSRSAKACAKMQEMGFTELYNLKGGYTSWQEMSTPTLKTIEAAEQ